MEENNRKGPGIFYAVTGIATLVVAIVGATFAFFAASANDANTIQGSTAEAAGITLNVSPVTNTGDDMIPLNLHTGDGEKDTTDQFTQAMTGKCKDINQNNVCQVYKITIKNNSTTSKIDVRGDVKVTGATNMKWQLLNVTNDVEATFAAAEFDWADTSDQEEDGSVTNNGVTGQLVRDDNATTGTGVAARKTLGTAEGIDIENANTAVYYILIWLEEMGADQGTADANKDFTGVVNFNAVAADGSTSGITASFA